MSVRPSKGTSVRFTPTDGAKPTHTPDSVAGLRFTIKARYGGAVEVDLIDLRPRALAISFAGALRRAADIGGALGAASTIKQHMQGYRRFFKYLRKRSSVVNRLSDLNAEHIDGFEAALEASGMTPIHRHTVIGKIVLALRSIDVDRPGMLREDLHRRLAYTSARSAGRSRPRDAYGPFVARQLRDAARAEIDRLFRRIGSPIVDEGDDDLRRAAAVVEAEIVTNGRIGSDHPAFKSLYFMRLHRGLPVSTLIKDLHGRHHLLSTDLPPLLTLLSLETGLEIECCKTLTVDCLRNPSAGTVEITYYKRRAHGAEHKHLRVRDGGIGTPGGLIRKLIEVTAKARQFVQTDCLWVYHHVGHLTSGILHPRRTIDAWTKLHGVVDDDGQPLRLILSRLRKTHKALWYLKTEGHMARFAVGHTPEVAARHYADLPSLQPLHEAAVADAFTEAVSATDPIILPPDEEARWRNAPEAVEVLAQSTDVPGLLDGEQDVWLASCSGFHNSPFGEAGSPCPQPFWGCLDCRNAVITARKLPAILAFLNFIEGERAGLSAADWDIKFGHAHARITQQVLPAFSATVIAEARSNINAQTLYLPPEARP
jgi:hypothetical protein